MAQFCARLNVAEIVPKNSKILMYFIILGYIQIELRQQKNPVIDRVLRVIWRYKYLDKITYGGEGEI